MTKPILIAGGGPASFLLAHSLKRSNIPFLVFERDASMVWHAQGYRLRLSSVGLDAIEQVLGPAGFQKFYDACGKTSSDTGLVHIDPLTGETVSQESSGAQREQLLSRANLVIGISRGDMRKLFMEGCEDSIRWSHHVKGYERTADGVVAIFADGSKSEEGSMLIGAEGIKSTVARQLTNGALKVYDLGARGIHGQAPTTAFRGLGEGVFRLVDSKSHPNGSVFLITNVRQKDMHDPNVIFGWTMAAAPGLIKAPNDDYTSVGKPAADIAKELTKNWHPRVKPLFDEMREHETAFWKITCSDPKGVPEWTNDPRVTLIGDAVHSMTPAGGNGWNTAARDSALLGRLLAEAGGYQDGLTDRYEKEMRVYASAEIKKSFGQMSAQFNITIDENTPIIGTRQDHGAGS